jgi:flagellin-like protein
MVVKLLQRRAELDRGISAIVGAVILLAITILFATFYIVALDKLATASQQVMERISEAGASTATLSSIKALWSFNGTHITIYIENQAPKTVLVAAIAIIYSDGSYTTISRINGSIAAQVIIGRTTLNTLSLPLGLAPATKTVITLATGGKTPATVSLAIEASPITAVQAVPVKRIESTAIARAVSLSPTATLGATTWLGEAAIPTTRSATLSKTYPQVIVSKDIEPSLVRTGRGALVYTDFETPPSGWTSKGGNWSIVSGGYKGNALQGTDNNKGIGKASQYYYSATTFSSYTSLWVSTKVRLVSGTGSAGIYLLSGGNNLYAIEITTTGSLQVRSFNVDKKNAWVILNSTRITNFNINNWYVIVVYYAVTAGKSATFNAYVYDNTGTLVASLTAQSSGKNVFVPAYIGVGVDDVTALFDDFIISTADPRYVTVTSLPGANYSVKVYDSYGQPVGSAASDKSGTAQVSVVTDIVVGTGTDGSIKVFYNPSNNLVLSYTAPDNILGGDTYQYATGMCTATFSDVAQLSNVIELFQGNLTLRFVTNASITLYISVNGVQVYSGNFGVGSYNLVVPLPSTMLGSTSVFNITLYIASNSPFKVTVQNLGITAFGYFSDFVEKTLLVGTGTNIYFYNVTVYQQSLTPSYTVNAFTLFLGRAAITYDSSQYILYMVNASGIYSWNPLGWSFIDNACNATSVGTRVELVNHSIVVLPMVLSSTSYVCIYDLTAANVTFYALPAGYRPYNYTSSAVVKDSVVFTVLDSSGRVTLLMFNTTSLSFRVLSTIPFYCLAGLATDGSRIYVVPCGFWSTAISSDDSRGIAVWVYDIGTGMSALAVVRNTTAVNLLGYGDRVEVDMDQGILLAVDMSYLHIIDLQYLQIVKKTTVYST